MAEVGLGVGRYTVKAILKGVVSPDVPDLAGYVPAEPENFGFLLQLLIGLEDDAGFESFGVMVCTPQ